jgi:hypothetical protein
MPVEDMLVEANAACPTGLSHGWRLSYDEKFASGQPNPCLCNEDSLRMHYLLVC